MDLEAGTKRDAMGVPERRRAVYHSPSPWGFLAFLERVEFGRDRHPLTVHFRWGRLFWILVVSIPPQVAIRGVPTCARGKPGACACPYVQQDGKRKQITLGKPRKLAGASQSRWVVPGGSARRESGETILVAATTIYRDHRR